ncbi:MAG TPA: hypothetical protein VM388_08580 [Acidimicrobiales bacterium]|nr:hypothetical protein [Acidimicrobiales bacterium]
MADDRILKVTRAIAIGIIPILTAAFVILFLFPSRTPELWAWTIQSRMMAMLMGGGYLAGAYYFFRVARGRRWHRIGVGIPAITLFAALLGATTFLHWDRFNHDHISFWAWTALYVTTPVLLPWLWVRNRRFDPGTPEPGERLVPDVIRSVMVTVGALQLLLTFALFLRPSLFIDEWMWPLTPLTARTLSAFVGFPAVVYLSFALDRRASSFRIPIELVTVGLAMIGIASIRAADEFRGSDVLVWGYRAGLLVTLALLITLRLRVLGERPG